MNADYGWIRCANYDLRTCDIWPHPLTHNSQKTLLQCYAVIPECLGEGCVCVCMCGCVHVWVWVGVCACVCVCVRVGVCVGD